jgi:hypothetical protein
MQMNDHMGLTERFQQINWLENVGQPTAEAESFGSVEEIIRLIENDADQFFQPPYTNPYERMCVEDHQAAAEVETSAVKERAREAAKKAYLTAWSRLPIPELCGLISDDVETIIILLMKGKPLREFTKERVGWYEKGRMPWGYSGEYPEGRWIVL